MSGVVGARRDRSQRPPAAVALALVAIVFFALPFAGILSAGAVVPALGGALVGGHTPGVMAVAEDVRDGGDAVAGVRVPLAWLLARVHFPGRPAVRALCTLSMVLPPVVAGVALFFSFGRRGLFGRWLDSWFGIQLPFTTAAVVMAQTFVAMPFLVITVEAAFRQHDARFDEAARTLGASRWYVFVGSRCRCRPGGRRRGPGVGTCAR